MGQKDIEESLQEEENLCEVYLNLHSSSGANAEGDHVGVLMIVTSPALFYQSISLEEVGRKLSALTFRNS